MNQHEEYEKISVVLSGDGNSYGLRVGGQNPVFVDCVHENGAAWKAGVKKGDHIVEVNGASVTAIDHSGFVNIIMNCPKLVKLTLNRKRENN